MTTVTWHATDISHQKKSNFEHLAYLKQEERKISLQCTKPYQMKLTLIFKKFIPKFSLPRIS